MSNNTAEILAGLKKIGEPFGVGESVVRKWIRDGAPIIRVDERRYAAEKLELWAWVKARGKADGRAEA